MMKGFVQYRSAGDKERDEELVRRNPQLKVLFMTGYSRDALVHHGRLDAGVSLLQKLITQKDLAKRLRVLLGVSAGRQPRQQDIA